MKTDALEIASTAMEPVEKLNFLREYIQACILRSLHESRAFECLSFVGGTALRFLFALPRFSEDLDFSIERAEGYEIEKWLTKLRRDLIYQGFETRLTINKKNTVHVAWIRIAGLLTEAGLSPQKDQTLAIKIEIDSNPPIGAHLERKIINRYALFGVQHHDLSCLMAGKIRALLTRPFTKGRDWFDLMWYITRIPSIEPNYDFLASALSQGSSNAAMSSAGRNWKKTLLRKLDSIDFDAVKTDVKPFLERRENLALLDRDLLKTMLDGNYTRRSS